MSSCSQNDFLSAPPVKRRTSSYEDEMLRPQMSSDANDSEKSSGDTTIDREQEVTPYAKEVAIFASSEEGQAIHVLLTAHLKPLMDDIIALYRMEYIFASFLRQWMLLSDSLAESNRQAYITEALVAVDPSALELKGDAIYDFFEAMIVFFEQVAWSIETYSGEYSLWHASVLKVVTPMYFFLAEVRNAIAAEKSIGEADSVAETSMKSQIVAEMEARPLVRSGYAGLAGRDGHAPVNAAFTAVVPSGVAAATSAAPGKGRNKTPSAAAVKCLSPVTAVSSIANSLSDFARPAPLYTSAGTAYSTVERIVVWENFAKNRKGLPKAEREDFHLRETGIYRSFAALKSQHQLLKASGPTLANLKRSGVGGGSSEDNVKGFDE